MSSYPLGVKVAPMQTGRLDFYGPGPQSTQMNVTYGTFICNGATPVTVSNTAVTASSSIIVTLKAVNSGTVGAIPAVKTITAGTGFTIAGTASDIGTYTYVILG